MLKFYQFILIAIFILALISFLTNCTGDDDKIQNAITKITGYKTK